MQVEYFNTHPAGLRIHLKPGELTTYQALRHENVYGYGGTAPYILALTDRSG
jgi:hypothetical protein